MKKRVLVTGGAGFIGSHLVDRLMKDPDVEQVRVVDDFSTGRRYNLPADADVEILDGDLINPKIAEKAVEDMDVIFHLAAASSVQGSITDPMFYHLNGDHMTMVLLDAASKAGVVSFIFASSASVYEDSRLPASEYMKPQPLSPYAVYKLNGEQYTKLFSRFGMNTASLRFFNVYGPRQFQGVIPKLCQSFLQQFVLPITGNGEQSRDFIYVSDVIEACIRVMNHPHKQHGQCWNVGTGRGTTINQLVECFDKVANAKTKKVYVDPGSDEIFHSRANIQNIYSTHSWMPTVSLEEGLKMTFNYWKEKV